MDADRHRQQHARDLLLEVAGLGGSGGEAGETAEEAAVAALERARRRALLVVILDWAALVALLVLADPGTPFLDPGPGERGVFTLAALAVAVHSGFRLGQLEKLRAVERLWREAGADSGGQAPSGGSAAS